MNIRIVEQVELFKLVLRRLNSTEVATVAVSPELSHLYDWYASQIVNDGSGELCYHAESICVGLEICMDTDVYEHLPDGTSGFACEWVESRLLHNIVRSTNFIWID